MFLSRFKKELNTKKGGTAMKTYKYTSDMIKAAIATGFTHLGGRGLKCNGCKNKSSARKFKKNGNTMIACKCGYRS